MNHDSLCPMWSKVWAGDRCDCDLIAKVRADERDKCVPREGQRVIAHNIAGAPAYSGKTGTGTPRVTVSRSATYTTKSAEGSRGHD